MSLRQIKELVKQHNIRGVSHLNLKELKEVLAERNIELPPRKPRAKREKKVLVSQSTETEELPAKEQAVVKEDERVKKHDYSRLKVIRNKPRRVKVTDLETNEETEYQSMFAAGKALGNSSKIITDYNGKVYKDKYKIEILTPTEANDVVSIDDAGSGNTDSDK